VVLARELGFDSEVIIVSQPTRGLDIRSANLVHQKLLDMRNNGAGILMVSSDLDENTCCLRQGNCNVRR